MSEVLNPCAKASTSFSSQHSHRIRNSPPHRKTRQGAIVGPFPATHSRSNGSSRTTGSRNGRNPRTAGRVFRPAAAGNQSVHLYRNRRLRIRSIAAVAPSAHGGNTFQTHENTTGGLVSCDCPCPRHHRRCRHSHRRLNQRRLRQPPHRCRLRCCQHFPAVEQEWIHDTNH